VAFGARPGARAIERHAEPIASDDLAGLLAEELALADDPRLTFATARTAPPHAAVIRSEIYTVDLELGLHVATTS